MKRFKLERWSPVITRLASGKSHRPPGRGPLGWVPGWGVSVGGGAGRTGQPLQSQPEREVTDSRIGRKSAWTFSGRVFRQGRAEGAERPPHRRVTAEKAVAPQSPLENYASSVFLQRGENPE